MLGRSREELVPGLRSLPFGRYVMGIVIVRVLHGARDLGPLFEGE
jgi:toxin ParE1/3/4